MSTRELVEVCRSFRGQYRLSRVMELTGLDHDNALQRLRQLQGEGRVTLKPIKSIHTTGDYWIYNRKPMWEPVTRNLAANTVMDKCWKAARHLKRFTAMRLVRVADVKEATAKSFIRRYREAGYLKGTRNGREMVYSFIGPPPVKRPSYSVNKENTNG